MGVVQAVDHLLAVPLAYHEPEVAQRAQHCRRSALRGWLTTREASDVHGPALLQGGGKDAGSRVGDGDCGSAAGNGTDWD